MCRGHASRPGRRNPAAQPRRGSADRPRPRLVAAPHRRSRRRARATATVDSSSTSSPARSASCRWLMRVDADAGVMRTIPLLRARLAAAGGSPRIPVRRGVAGTADALVAPPAVPAARRAERDTLYPALAAHIPGGERLGLLPALMRQPRDRHARLVTAPRRRRSRPRTSSSSPRSPTSAGPRSSGRDCSRAEAATRSRSRCCRSRPHLPPPRSTWRSHPCSSADSSSADAVMRSACTCGSRTAATPSPPSITSTPSRPRATRHRRTLVADRQGDLRPFAERWRVGAVRRSSGRGRLGCRRGRPAPGGSREASGTLQPLLPAYRRWSRARGAVVTTVLGARSRCAKPDRDQMEELAGRLRLAIDSARLLRQKMEIAHTLQRSLLPASLPQGPAPRSRSLSSGHRRCRCRR